LRFAAACLTVALALPATGVGATGLPGAPPGSGGQSAQQMAALWDQFRTSQLKAQQLSGQIAAETARLIAQTRAGTAVADDLRGSTFTVSNLGMFEIDAFTPIVNLPEAAILGLGIGAFLFVRRRKARAEAGPSSSMTSAFPSDLKPNTATGKAGGGLVDTGNSSFLTDFDKTGPGTIDTEEVDPLAEARRPRDVAEQDSDRLPDE